MNLRTVVAGVLLASAAAPASAALPDKLNFGIVLPTPSGRIDSRYRDGNDGTVAIPLVWGTCPSVNLTVGSACTTDLRTLCSLTEAGSPDATLSLLSGALPSGCSISGDGITGATVGGTSNSSVVVRATRNSDTADTAAFSVVATAAPVGDSTAPTVPLGLVGVDNADGTGTLTWDASSDPDVSGVVTGVASYRVSLGASTYTVSAPQANLQPALTETRIGGTDSESSSQSGADWTLTFGGAGLAATADHILGRFAAVTGDFTATAKITAYTPVSGTTGSIGIAARSSNSAQNDVVAYARWRDSDDKCNLRYRLSTVTNAANGTFSSAYTIPLWVKLTRASDNFSAYCSSDGNTWTLTSTQSVSPGQTVYVGPFITSGTATVSATGTVAQFNLHQGTQPTYLYTGTGGSFTVSSYDGTNRSAESAAVVLQPTGAVVVSSAPTKFVAGRSASTSATFEWKAPESGGTPTAYRIYQSSTENGTYSQVYEGLPTPDANLATYTYTLTTGVSAAAEPWFKIAAVVGGVESTLSAARKLSIGVVNVYADSVSAFPNNSSSLAPSATALFGGVSSTNNDSFGSIDYNANPAAVGGDLGMRLVKNRLFGGKWAVRSQLTFHTYGNNSPTSGVSASANYPGTVLWQTKGDGEFADKAHRNEFTFAAGNGFTSIDEGEEHWMGLAVYLPAESDANGDEPTRAFNSLPGNYVYGPQLHPTNCATGYSGNDCSITGQGTEPGFNPILTMQAGTAGYGAYGTTYGTNHPSGAPVIRYKRGDEQPLNAVSSGTLNATVGNATGKTTTPSTLYVEWDPVVGASTYRVEYAWSPHGVWQTASTDTANNITVDLTNRRVIATGLGQYSTFFSSTTNGTTRYIRVIPIIGGADGTTSLIVPAPRWHWQWAGNFSIDARPDYGRWTRWVMRYKRSSTGTGFREVWKDDVKVFSEFNATIGTANPAQSYYWKLGFYTGHPSGGRALPPIPMDFPWRRIVYFDEVRGAQRTGGASTATDTNDSAYQQVRPRGGVGE